MIVVAWIALIIFCIPLYLLDGTMDPASAVLTSLGIIVFIVVGLPLMLLCFAKNRADMRASEDHEAFQKDIERNKERLVAEQVEKDQKEAERKEREAEAKAEREAERQVRLAEAEARKMTPEKYRQHGLAWADVQAEDAIAEEEKTMELQLRKAKRMKEFRQKMATQYGEEFVEEVLDGTQHRREHQSANGRQAEA